MAPDLPAITKCAWCSKLYWVEEAKVIGEFFPHGFRIISPEAGGGEVGKWQTGQLPAEWLSLEPVRHLSEKDCLLALRGGLAKTRVQELYLRVRAWLAHNDAYRDLEVDVPTKRSFPQEARENMEKLRQLLDEEEYSDRILKAELERELGCFHEARRLLAYRFPEHLQDVVTFIDELAEKGDMMVRKIPRELE